MTSILYNFSGKINPILVSILRIIQQETAARGMLYFVVGATARDLLLHHGHGLPIRRGTLDLDIAVEVAGWEEFQQLKDALIATERFTPTSQPQRLIYESFWVDIVPFGGISSENQTIRWPPDHQVIMNMMGFSEACSHGAIVRLSEDPPLDIRVPTIPGMALMKLISWDDDYPNRSKDAEDLLFLITTYADAGNIDRLFDDEPELLKQEGFDTTIAGIRLLGRDMADMADSATGAAVQRILSKETDGQQRYRLVTDMAKGSRLHDSFDEMFAKLQKLTEGFIETSHGKNLAPKQRLTL